MHRSNHLKNSVPFITVGGGDCQCGKNACKADDTMAMETTIGLFFGRTIAKSSPVAKKFAALRTGKEAYGYGKAITHRHGSMIGMPRLGYFLLETLFDRPQMGGMSRKVAS